MRKLGVALFAGLAFVVLLAASDLTGNWMVEVDFDDNNIPGGGFDCAFKQNGDQLTGDCARGAAPLIGEVKGQSVSWQMKAGGTSETITYTGTVNETGTSIKGRFTMADKGGRFTATKE